MSLKVTKGHFYCISFTFWPNYELDLRSYGQCMSLYFLGEDEKHERVYGEGEEREAGYIPGKEKAGRRYFR